MTPEKDPRISIIMVDGSFRESYHSIDFLGKQTIPADDYELLWVEYYDKVKSELAEEISKYPNFRVITLEKEGPYHSSYCFNAGIRASRGELIFIPDADVVVEDYFLEKAWAGHQANDKLVMYFYRYNEFEKDHLPEVNIEHLQKVCVLTNPSNYGGCLSVRKKWLLEINGYEQHPTFGSGFHANGLDVYTRLKNLGLHVKWHPELRLYHPWHLGALVPPPFYNSYKIQKIVINYRAVTLATKPFQGIDFTQNSELPADLAAKIEAVTRTEAVKRGHDNKFRKLFAKLGALFQ
jgi:hypothetical protein